MLDPNTILEAVKNWGPIIVTVACFVTAVLPRPTSGPLLYVWKALDFVAFNFGNAKNTQLEKK